MESFKALFLSLGKDNKLWIAEIFLWILLAAVAVWLLRIFISRLKVRAKTTVNLWDDALVGAINPSASILIWLFMLSFVADRAASVTGTEIFSAVGSVRKIGVIVLVTWFALRFTRGLEKNLASPNYLGKPMDVTTVRAIGKLVRVSILMAATIAMMQGMGYSVSGILAFGGIGGLALGFAAKDLLANFFGGLMIHFDRPFAVGDWIRSPDKEIEGTVEDIGWRLTRIRTFDQRPLYIPNSIFTQIAVENPSRMLNRRIYETIGIRYQDAHLMPEIVKGVSEMLRQHPEIDSKQTLMVNFTSFAPSSLDFFVYTFTKTTDWVYFQEIKQDVLLKILSIITGHGGFCAFPTSTLHIEAFPGQASTIKETLE